MVNKNFFLSAVVLIAAHWFGKTIAKEECLWCDQRMALRFTNCLFVEIISDPVLDVLERELLLDMKSSLYAASLGIKSSPDPVKNQIMNGALAGELSGMISSHSTATGQRPEVAADEIMRLIGYCYFTVTEHSEVHFVNSLRRAVTDIIRDSDNYQSQDDYVVSTSNQYAQNNQPQPMPPKNVFPNNDVPSFDYNFSDQQTQTWPQTANAVAAATSLSNQNFDNRPAIDVAQSVQINPNLPNRDFVASFVNQDFDRPPTGVLSNREILPLNPLQSNGPPNLAMSQTQEKALIPPNNENNSPFWNQDLPIQPSFLGQPKILDTQPDFLPNGNPPVSLPDQYFENRAPSPELSLIQKSVSLNYPSTSNQDFAPFQNEDMGNQPLPATPNIYQNGQNNPIPNRQFPDLSNSNSGFPDITPQIRETILPNSFPNSQGLVPFANEDFNYQRPVAAQSQSFGNMPNNAQPNNQFSPIISNNDRNPGLRPSDYDYPTFTRENFQNYQLGRGTEKFPQRGNNGLPLESSYLASNINQQLPNEQDSFRFSATPELPADGGSNVNRAQPVGISPPYQNGANIFDSTLIAPVDGGFGTYDTGQQATQMSQGESVVVEPLAQTLGQNNQNNPRTDGIYSDNSNFEGVYPSEQDSMNFQPMGSGSYQPGPNEDTFQNGIKVNSEECAMEFSETLFVHLLKTKIIHSVFGTNTLPSSVKQKTSEAIRRAFIENCMPEYADQAAEYSSQQIGSLPESSSTQAYADKISKSVSDVMYRNGAIMENCFDTAISMTSAIARWLEALAFANTRTETSPMLTSNLDAIINPSSNDSSSNMASTNQNENQQSKNNSSATSFSKEQEDYCDDDEVEDSSMQQTQNAKAENQDDDCDDDEVEDPSMQQTQNGKANNQDDFCEDEDTETSEGTNKSKLSDAEAKSHFNTLMSAIRNSVSYDGFNYPKLTSAMSSIIYSIDNKHPDWNSDEVLTRVNVETITALTLVLQETAMSRS